MLHNFYYRVSKIPLKYHQLTPYEEHRVLIRGKSLHPYGVDEVMRIKYLADMFELQTHWDGRDITVSIAHEDEWPFPESRREQG
ncbi:MAG: hypothetical protein R3302_00395 [Sulfurimonadaceae bacterium]|nr:hypothetical protein [Sulfurimonadaceae bacterium]